MRANIDIDDELVEEAQRLAARAVILVKLQRA
ncbi:MAG TPA: type II toxin-antitoxin system VapB family antitoxin [Stellaceae bacterium]|nr:type II toxin-antitoxin system VapB family antitoxin [Stellaceae bacterium]